MFDGGRLNCFLWHLEPGKAMILDSFPIVIRPDKEIKA